MGDAVDFGHDPGRLFAPVASWLSAESGAGLSAGARRPSHPAPGRSAEMRHATGPVAPTGALRASAVAVYNRRLFRGALQGAHGIPGSKPSFATALTRTMVPRG
jgi:hypothetical protein